ncbi:A/B/D/E cyclin, partial [Neocallimastix sp. 'constans']
TSTFKIKKEQDENILSNNMNKKEGHRLKLFPKVTSGKAILHTTRSNRTALSDVSNKIPLQIKNSKIIKTVKQKVNIPIPLKEIEQAKNQLKKPLQKLGGLNEKHNGLQLPIEKVMPRIQKVKNVNSKINTVINDRPSLIKKTNIKKVISKKEIKTAHILKENINKNENRSAGISQPPLKETTIEKKEIEEKKENNEKEEVSLLETLKTSIDNNKLKDNEEFQKDLQDWEDLDAEDANDPSMVSEYVNEIFDYMRELEKTTMPNPKYMDHQEKLSWKMRTVLIDWLIDIHNQFRLLPETLYLAVNIVDRFLSSREVDTYKLQLVGVTAMFIAAKYEEIVAPSVQNYLCVQDLYNEDEILRAERYVLKALDFGLHYPNPMSFLRRNSKADNYDPLSRTFAKFLMELSLIDHRFLFFPPSKVAAAAMYLSRLILDRGEWNANMRHYSGYTEEELSDCVDLMLLLLLIPRKNFPSIQLLKKYESKKFMKASLHITKWVYEHMSLIEKRLSPKYRK